MDAEIPCMFLQEGGHNAMRAYRPTNTAVLLLIFYFQSDVTV